MELSKSGATFLRLHEGFVDHYYADAVGVGTIGIGFTWASLAFRVWWGANKLDQKFGPGATITRKEAEEVLITICRNEYGKAVNSFLGKAVAQNVYDGMVSPVYNCGAGTLSDRWAKAAKAGDLARAAELLETTRTTARGKRLAGLVRRRKEEAKLIREGVYTGVFSQPAPATPDPMADGILVRGERGAAVAQLINDLIRLRLYSAAPDDLFGYRTEAAVLAFQRAHRLKDDGWAGPKTLNAISVALTKIAS